MLWSHLVIIQRYFRTLQEDKSNVIWILTENMDKKRRWINVDTKNRQTKSVWKRVGIVLVFGKIFMMTKSTARPIRFFIQKAANFWPGPSLNQAFQLFLWSTWMRAFAGIESFFFKDSVQKCWKRTQIILIPNTVHPRETFSHDSWSSFVKTKNKHKREKQCQSHDH